jgi:aspartate carbamoyltransferase regulatory subunit
MAKGLTPEQIQLLLAKPEKSKSATGKTIDTTIRDAVTWFKLAHKLFDEETQETAKCENPNCQDPREGVGAVVAKVNGRYMCRYCYLDGWLLVNPNQSKL